MSDLFGLEYRYLNHIHYTPVEVDELGQLEKGDWVMTRTRRGKEIGRVKQRREHEDPEEMIGIDPFVRRILRPAEEADHEREEQNRIREAQAIRIGDKKVEMLGLPMRLIRVHYLFDHSRIIFYFKAPHKVDFRELVRELAAVFKTRIELRQIGVRDEAKILGGMGICGRELCCTTWMRDFFPVTVRMAKDQHLSPNPTNISGICGRLKCCLVYEQPFYEVSMRGLPPLGSIVVTSLGPGKLLKTNIFTDVAAVLTDQSQICEVPLSEIRGQGGRISARRGRATGRRDGVRRDEPRDRRARPSRAEDDADRRDRSERRREERRGDGDKGRRARRPTGHPGFDQSTHAVDLRVFGEPRLGEREEGEVGQETGGGDAPKRGPEGEDK